MSRESLLDQAYFYYEETQEFEKALQVCDNVIEIEPEFADAYNLRGVVLEELGRDLEARQDYQQAIWLDPKFAEAKANLAELKEKLASANHADSIVALVWNDSINALFHPSTRTFTKQISHANILVALLWVAIAGGLTGFIQAATLMYIYTDNFTGSIPSNVTTSLTFNLVFQTISSTITAVVLLISIAVVYYVIASVMGSNQNFAAQVYLMATYTAPLYFLAGVGYQVLRLSSFFSNFLSYAYEPIFENYLNTLTWAIIFIGYHIYLSYFAIKAIHGFETEKATKVTKVFVAIVIVILLTYTFLVVGLPFLFFFFAQMFYRNKP